MILYDDLQRSLTTGNVCAFVGAGLSAGAGLPGWYDLIAELSARIGYELPPANWATGDALIDAAQAYVNRQGLHSLISHLKDRLDATGKEPTVAHRALARLPISLVFTANFDDLLERAFRDAGKRVEVVVKDSSIPFMRRGPDTVNIVKLYGDLDQPETIVLARQQYESYFLQRPQIVKLLETELARSDTLYMGWSGSDPYFKLVFGELLSRFGQMMRPGYAAMFDVTDAQRDELTRKQIRPVELPAGDRTAQLAAWMESLGPSANPQQSTNITRGGAHHALVVDDSRENRRRLARLIQDLGCETVEAQTNDEAIKLLLSTRRPFDLVTTDAFRRPENAGESGYVGLDLIRTINARFSEIPVVLVSRDDPELLRKQAPDLQVAALLGKDLADEQVRGALRQVLDGEIMPKPWSKIPGSQRIAAKSTWNTSTLRELLTSAFNDEELTTLCFDTFRPVYDDFAIGMSKGQKVQRLLDYCTRQEQVDDLLAAVQKANPRKYAQYEGKLKG